MGGLSSHYRSNPGRAAVDAFKAGNDVLTIPADLDASFRAMLDAVRSGEISQQRLDASVSKILKAKASLGLQKNRLVDVKAIARLVGRPENAATGQRISDDSVTLVRDNGKLLPFARGREGNALVLYQRVKSVRPPVLVVILCDSIRAEDGRVLEREIHARMPDANVVYVDRGVAYVRSDQVMKAVDDARAVVVAVYIVPSAARTMTVTRGLRNLSSLPTSTAALFGRILARAGEKTAVLAMGNPYLTEDFPGIQNYICTFSNATVSEVSVARALFGEIPMHGHMPVSIHNVAVRAEKIESPARLRETGSVSWRLQNSQSLLNATQAP
jgi:beta-N-acetylhexosaminidase